MTVPVMAPVAPPWAKATPSKNSSTMTRETKLREILLIHSSPEEFCEVLQQFM
jgi:hypothetical protein